MAPGPLRQAAPESILRPPDGLREAGDWEGWLKFFLGGIAETADEAVETARAILNLREQHRGLLQEKDLGVSGLRLLDLLFEQPLVNVNAVKSHLKVSFVTANKLVEQFEKLHLLKETTGGQRNRRYRYAPYLSLFESEEETSKTAPVQEAEPSS